MIAGISGEFRQRCIPKTSQKQYYLRVRSNIAWESEAILFERQKQYSLRVRNSIVWESEALLLESQKQYYLKVGSNNTWQSEAVLLRNQKLYSLGVRSSIAWESEAVLLENQKQYCLRVRSSIAWESEAVLLENQKQYCLSVRSSIVWESKAVLLESQKQYRLRETSQSVHIALLNVLHQGCTACITLYVTPPMTDPDVLLICGSLSNNSCFTPFCSPYFICISLWYTINSHINHMAPHKTVQVLVFAFTFQLFITDNNRYPYVAAATTHFPF